MTMEQQQHYLKLLQPPVLPNPPDIDDLQERVPTTLMTRNTVVFDDANQPLHRAASWHWCELSGTSPWHRA